MGTATEQQISIRISSLVMGDVAKHWGVWLFIGILSLLTGIAAIIVPQIAALAVEMLLGGLFIFVSFLQGIHAYHMHRRRGFGLSILTALLSLIVGVLLLVFPLSGVMTLTLVIGVFFFLGGFLKSILAFQLRPLQGWGWMLFSGIISLGLGVLIFSMLTQSAAWVIGILVGIDLIFGGWWLIMSALAARKWRQSSE